MNSPSRISSKKLLRRLESRLVKEMELLRSISPLITSEEPAIMASQISAVSSTFVLLSLFRVDLILSATVSMILLHLFMELAILQDLPLIQLMGMVKSAAKARCSPSLTKGMTQLMSFSQQIQRYSAYWATDSLSHWAGKRWSSEGLEGMRSRWNSRQLVWVRTRRERSRNSFNSILFIIDCGGDVLQSTFTNQWHSQELISNSLLNATIHLQSHTRHYMKLGTLLQQALERAKQLFTPTPPPFFIEEDFDKEKESSELEATRATIIDPDQDGPTLKKQKKFKKPAYARKPTMLPNMLHSEGQILHQIQMKQSQAVHFNFASERPYDEETDQEWEERMVRYRMEHAKYLMEKWRDSQANKRQFSCHGLENKSLWEDEELIEPETEKMDEEEEDGQQSEESEESEESQESEEENEENNKRVRSYSLDVMTVQVAEAQQNIKIIDEYQQPLNPKIRILRCPQFNTPEELQEIKDLIKKRRTIFPNVVSNGDHPNPGSYTMKYMNQKYRSLTYRSILKADRVMIENEHMIIRFGQPINLYRKDVEDCIKMSKGRLEIHDSEWKKAAFTVTFKNVEGFPREAGKQREDYIRLIKQHQQSPQVQGQLTNIGKDCSLTWAFILHAKQHAQAALKRKRMRKRERRERERERERLKILQQLEEQENSQNDSMYW